MHETLNPASAAIELPKGPNPKIGIYISGTLALMIFFLSAFMAIEAMNSVNPEGDAKYVGVASAILLALINFGLCAISGLFPEYKKSFSLLSKWVIIIELAFMVLSQVSTAITAGKVANRSDEVVKQLKAKADASLEQVKAAQDTARNLNGSKHGWRHEQAAQQTNLAAIHSKRAASDVSEYANASTKGAVVSSPLVELVGKNVVFVLYTLLCGAFSIAGVTFTRTMADLIRKSTGALTPEAQTLALAEKIYQAVHHAGKPALPRPAAPDTAPAPVQQDTAPATGHEKAVTAPLPKSWWSTIWKGALPALPFTGAGAGQPPAPVQPGVTAPPSISAPGRQAEAPKLRAVTAPDQVQSKSAAPATAPEQVQSTAPGKVQSAPATEISNASIAVPDTAPTTAPPQVQRKAKQKRIPAPKALPEGDTLSEQAQTVWVYEQVRDAVRAEDIRPSTRGLRLVVGCSDPIANGHLARMRDEGVIIFNEEKKQGWKLAPGQSTKQESKVA